MSLIGKELGELLVDNGLLTPEELEQVEAEKLKTGDPLRCILERLKLATENQLKNTLELQFAVTYVSLYKTEPDLEVIDLLPIKVVRQYLAVPISREGSRVTVAMVNPEDQAALSALKEHLKADVKPLVCMEDDFEIFLDAVRDKRLDQVREQLAASQPQAVGTANENGHEPNRQMAQSGDDSALPHGQESDSTFQPEATHAPPPQRDDLPAKNMPAQETQGESPGQARPDRPDEGQAPASGLARSTLGSRAHQQSSTVRGFFKKNKGEAAKPEEKSQTRPEPAAPDQADPLVPTWLAQLPAETRPNQAPPAMTQPAEAPISEAPAAMTQPAEASPAGAQSLDTGATSEISVPDIAFMPEVQELSGEVAESTTTGAGASENVEALMAQLATSASPGTAERESYVESVSQEQGGQLAEPSENEQQLIELGLLAKDQLPAVRAELTNTGDAVSIILERLGIASKEEICDALDMEYGVDYVSLPEINIDAEALDLLPERIILERRVLPLQRQDNRIVLAMVNPDDLIAENDIKFRLKDLDVKKVVCLKGDFDHFIQARFASRKDKPQHDSNGSHDAAQAPPAAEQPPPAAEQPPPAAEQPPPAAEPAPPAAEPAPPAAEQPPPQTSSTVAPVSLPPPSAEPVMPPLPQPEARQMVPPPLGVQPVQFPPRPAAVADSSAAQDKQAPCESISASTTSESKGQAESEAAGKGIAEAHDETAAESTAQGEATSEGESVNESDDVDFLEMATQALDNTLLALANEMLLTAASKGFTHIHVEPQREELELRYWVEHSLVESKKLEKSIHLELVRCFKSIAGLDLSVANRPQDKRLHTEMAGAELDIRVTTIPGEFGEMVAVSIKFPEDE